MDNTEHTHRLSFSWGIGDILIGSFLILIVFGTLVVSAHSFISGDASVSDYLGVVFLIFLMLPVGVDLLARPFVTRVVVRVHGIEYHTTTYVLLAEWKDLVNVGYSKNRKRSRLILAPKAGQLTLRSWARPLQRILRHKPEDIEIMVSQFRTSNGHTFEVDVVENVPQRGEFSTEVESL